VKQAEVYLDTASMWPPGRSAAIWLIDTHWCNFNSCTCEYIQ
jgi:hypothetical protein